MAPLHIGDTIIVEARIDGKRCNPKRPEDGLVDEVVTVRNQHGDLSLVLTHVCLVERATTASASVEAVNR